MECWIDAGNIQLVDVKLKFYKEVKIILIYKNGNYVSGFSTSLFRLKFKRSMDNCKLYEVVSREEV